MATESRLDQLSDLTRAYADRAYEAIQTVQSFGDSVIEQLPAFLGAGAEVCGVPPENYWEPTEYNDAKYSFFDDARLRIAPIRMGVGIHLPMGEYLRSGNWARVVVEMEVQGGELLATVGPLPQRRLNPDAPEAVTQVCQDVFDYLRELFEGPMRLVQEEKLGRIGFDTKAG